ncbi:unnamed protein product [Schistosoma turkestanicum]|nr:unnamed protein product [Schistosoma turkestanicum]
MFIPEDQIWMVVVGFIIAFVLAFGIGANDVANSFGTSVGAKVLTLKQACILATICELSGSVLLGAKVSSTLRKGIVSVERFQTIDSGHVILMAGQVAALGGSCIWLLVATFFRLPVSGTHSIVGATMGFSLVIFGLNAIQWKGMLKIVGSWFLSPVLSGLASTGVFFLMRVLVLSKEDSLEPALRLIPGFFGTVVLVNSFSIFYEGPPMLKFDKIPLYGVFILSCGLGIITVLLVKFIWVPIVRRHILKFDVKPSNPDEMGRNSNQLNMTLGYSSNDQNAIGDGSHNLTNGKFIVSSPPNLSTIGEEPDHSDLIKDRPAEAQVFSSLQIITAVFGSFAHGGNDVSNAIGPLIGLWLIATTQLVDSSKTTDLWILVYGGVGISVGLWIWGRRVIQTLGEDLSQMTPSSGVSIEIGSALTVLIASKIGLPISTTHCKVGSVVFVGRARSKDNVNWGIFRNILLAWLVTLPAAGAISALLMYIFTFIV